MSAVRPILWISLALASLTLSGGAGATPIAATKNATGQASVLKSLSILKQNDLDFGDVIPTSAGTVIMDPVSGALTTTGTLTLTGTSAHPATFTATGSKNSVVHVQIPTNPVTLTLVGGSATMTVSNWTMDGAANRKIPPNNAFNFNVAGTLNVGAGQLDGTYTGTFAVTVQYP